MRCSAEIVSTIDSSSEEYRECCIRAIGSVEGLRDSIQSTMSSVQCVNRVVAQDSSKHP